MKLFYHYVKRKDNDELKVNKKTYKSYLKNNNNNY